MDADCLIKLTRADLKEQVCRAFSVTIPARVRQEVVEEGRRHPDSTVVAQNMSRGLIREAPTPGAQRGEDAAVALFAEGSYDAVASDDRRSVRRLRLRGVPYVSPGVLVFLLARDGRISLHEANRALQRLAPMVSDEDPAGDTRVRGQQPPWPLL